MCHRDNNKLFFIEAEALFVKPNTGNYQLQPASPCINKGINQGWMTNGKDLDGVARIDSFSGRVDMGAYEYMPHGSLFGVW